MRLASLALICPLLSACYLQQATVLSARGDGGVARDGEPTSPYTDGSTYDGLATSCPPLNDVELRIERHAGGDWSLVLDPNVRYRPLGEAQHVAAVLDHDKGGQHLAAFIVAGEPSGVELSTHVNATIARLLADLQAIGTSARFSDPTLLTTHDGFPAAFDAVISVETATTSNVSQVRYTALETLLQHAAPNLPPAIAGSVTAFRLHLTAVLRPDRVIWLGGVSEAAGEQDASKNVRQMVRDMVSPQVLARANATTEPLCERTQRTNDARDAIDLIWLVDESASMTAHRQALAERVPLLLGLGTTFGVDFRMGVARLAASSDDPSAGRFCSASSTLPQHEGGTDRFLAAAERQTLQACIRNPAGSGSSDSYAFLSARQAVLRHLPRRQGELSQIRPNANVVMVALSNRVPSEIERALGSDVTERCTLNAAEHQQINHVLGAEIARLAATSGASLSRFYALAGNCSQECSATNAHGYSHLSTSIGGITLDLCGDLEQSLQRIFFDAVSSLASVELDHTPIPQSLRVIVGDRELTRGAVNGFFYSSPSRKLRFPPNSRPSLGTDISITFRTWR
ncbi:MAG: hypothetical protein H6707_19345 [Deltaproteobacteria bacterium]|nr:hypothetical protein [Deltaproteobacteria bacterium]